MLTEEQLPDLFAEGTAPEYDAAFTLQVATEIGRARLRMRLLTLGMRAAALLVLSGAAYVGSRLIESPLARLVEGTPQFMGVPAPTAVLGIIFAGLTLRARRHLPFRRFVSRPS